MSDHIKLREAALACGHVEPISIEPDGTIWTGSFDDKKHLTDNQLKKVHDKVVEITKAKNTALASARTKLAALGLSDAEIGALLGG